MTRGLLRFGFAATFALGLGVANAAPGDYPQCTKKASPSELESAKGAHKAATEFYDRGEYDKAIQYWRDAYNFDCNAHPVLINIANANEKKGDRAAAIVALETYQVRTGGTNTTIAEKLNTLKAQLAAAPPPPPSTTGGPPIVNNPDTGPAQQPGTQTSSERPFGVAPWVVVGAGGVAALVGAILIPVGYGGISSAEEECLAFSGSTNRCPPDVASSGNGARLQVGIGWVLAGVGAAALTGGLVWQLGFNAKPATKTGGLGPSVTVVPAVGPGHTGLSLAGRF